MRYAIRLALIVIALSVGCSSSDAPSVEADYDSKRARLALTKALDAWQAGRAADLPRGTPPIRFVDDDWASGQRLVGYRLQDRDAEIRPFTNVMVQLSLSDPRGKTRERTVTYQIALHPQIAVLRGD